jgi:hypothetical protein
MAPRAGRPKPRALDDSAPGQYTIAVEERSPYLTMNEQELRKNLSLRSLLPNAVRHSHTDITQSESFFS